MSGVSFVFGAGDKRPREAFNNVHEKDFENQHVLDQLHVMPYKEKALLINKLAKNDFVDEFGNKVEISQEARTFLQKDENLYGLLKELLKSPAFTKKYSYAHYSKVMSWLGIDFAKFRQGFFWVNSKFTGSFILDGLFLLQYEKELFQDEQFLHLFFKQFIKDYYEDRLDQSSPRNGEKIELLAGKIQDPSVLKGALKQIIEHDDEKLAYKIFEITAGCFQMRDLEAFLEDIDQQNFRGSYKNWFPLRAKIEAQKENMRLTAFSVEDHLASIVTNVVSAFLRDGDSPIKSRSAPNMLSKVRHIGKEAVLKDSECMQQNSEKAVFAINKADFDNDEEELCSLMKSPGVFDLSGLSKGLEGDSYNRKENVKSLDLDMEGGAQKETEFFTKNNVENSGFNLQRYSKIGYKRICLNSQNEDKID